MRSTRPRRALIATIAVLALTPAAANAATCAFDPSATASAVPEPQFNDLFRAYGDSNKSADDWTGADTTNSVLLPDGRVSWIFSDTFLGKVNPDGSRSDPVFVHNSIVLQDGARLTKTLHSGRYPNARSLVQSLDGKEVEGDPPVGSDWYWLGDGTVDGDKLRVFALKFEKYGPGGFDFRWVSTAIATFALPKMELLDVSPTYSGNGVEWGSGLMEDGDWTYIYGTDDQGLTKYAHLARAPRGDLHGVWQFWDGTGWSSDQRASKPLMAGVANEYSVTKVGDAYVLVTMDTRTLFSRDIVAYVSCSPTGPWGAPTTVYTAPDYAGTNPNAFVYNAHAHPEFTHDGKLLISYNVNSFSFQDLMSDVHVYRPRFIRATLPPIVRTP
jgi:hypothetical protein